MSGVVGAGHQVIALTGATGFIGTELNKQLLAAGYRVRALYRPRRGRTLLAHPRLEWISGDLADHAALMALMTGAEAVIHCAGAVSGARRTDFDRINESGVLNAVQVAVREPSCRRFLLLSSLAARMPQLSDYAGSKWRGECALAANAGRLNWTVLRPPAVYGPGDREMLPLFRSMARGLAPVPGAGRGRFSLIYVADLASAVVNWLTADNDRGEAYELDDGHDHGYDWNTVLAVAARVLRDNAPIRRVTIPVPLLRVVSWINLVASRGLGYAPMLTPGKVRELTHPDWVCDGSAFAQATGWHPAVEFECGLACTFGRPIAALNGVS